MEARRGQYRTVSAIHGGKPSAFSSYGPSPGLGLKPGIAAPGGGIYSTYPLALGGYATISGTSMAAPYVAGAVALMKEAHPNMTVDEIRSALFTTARPISDDTTTLNYNPYRVGAGLIDIYAAITARASVSPPALPIGNAEYEPFAFARGKRATTYISRKTLTVTNRDRRSAMHVGLANSPADSLSEWLANGTHTAALRTWPEDATKPYESSQIPMVYSPKMRNGRTIRPGESYSFEVMVVPPTDLKFKDRWFYGGYITLTMAWKDGRSSEYSVPYAGFKGDFSKVDVLADKDQGYPTVVNADGVAVDSVSSTVTGRSPIAVKVKLNVPSGLLKVSVFDSKGNFAGYIGYQKNVHKNTASDGIPFYLFKFDGHAVESIEDGPRVLPSGEYYIRVDALRPFGDPEKADYQSWDSPKFKYRA